ncbi:DNA repair protein RadA [Lactococcus lactis]|nr:DNA repair protein RadA [Lactococcus lactis]
MQNQDAYLKSAGGVKLDEPAIDLRCVVLFKLSKELPTDLCFIGEIGLTGEIRRVTRIEQRLNEAAKLGFKKVYAPKNSIVGIDIPEQIQVIGVTTLTECLKLVFG